MRTGQEEQQGGEMGFGYRERARRARRTLLLITAFELSLGLVAIGVGWMFGFLLWDRFWPQPIGQTMLQTTGIGLLAALPMAVGLLGLESVQAAPMQRIREILQRHLLPLFRDSPPSHLLVISLAAGLGEETLFRGAIQGGLAEWLGGGEGELLAVLVASVAFGLAHCVTWTYFGLACLMGGFFGWLFWWTGALWTPIVTHAAYDFFALLYLLRQQNKRPGLEDQAAFMSPDQLISSEQSESSEVG